ncbi:MAG: zinc-binding dehydrogenase [Chitinophagaceae bacterium]
MCWYDKLFIYFPTIFFSILPFCRSTDFQPGDSVAFYGADPVGLMAIHSANIKNASRIMVVDNQKDRLKLAEELGAIAIDYSKGSAVDQVLELTKGAGANKGCECVGYECCNKHGAEQANVSMNELVQAVKATGAIGVVGVLFQRIQSQKNLCKRKDTWILTLVISG